jgi:hypothetical protein
MITVLIFSLATGAMALTRDRGWVYLTVMRFIVGVGVVGVAAVDIASPAGVCAGCETRLDQRAVDRPGAGRGVAGRDLCHLSRRCRRLARALRVPRHNVCHRQRMAAGARALGIAVATT